MRLSGSTTTDHDEIRRWVEARGGKPAPEGNGADPVLESVMAQFEMLQKDLARRRKVAASSG